MEDKETLQQRQKLEIKNRGWREQYAPSSILM
jgi:hypothetical protein